MFQIKKKNWLVQPESKMISKLIKLTLLLLISQMLPPVRAVLADTGPKPTMDFQFQFESGVEESGIISGILFECNEADCSDAAPLEKLGPQGLYCEVQSCLAIGYGFAPFSMLEIEFSDGMTRRSNIFEQVAFDSYYTVYVRPDDLHVEARFSLTAFPRISIIIFACICASIGLGLLAGLAVFLIRRSKKNWFLLFWSQSSLKGSLVLGMLFGKRNLSNNFYLQVSLQT